MPAALGPFPTETLAVTSRPRLCSADLTLTLHRGLRIPVDHLKLTASRQTPGGAVVTHVPLYPGSVRTALPMVHDSSYSVPHSMYMKGATAMFLAPIGLGSLENWYSTEFRGCGWKPTVGNMTGSDLSVGYAYSDQSDPPVQVWTVLLPEPHNTTLVMYIAYVIVPPPPFTMVPGAPVSIRVTAYISPGPGVSAGHRPSIVVTSRNARLIAQIVQQLNSLAHWDGVVTSCPADTGAHDILRFTYRDGHMLKVDVHTSGCLAVQSGKKSELGLPPIPRADLSKLLTSPSAVHPRSR